MKIYNTLFTSIFLERLNMFIFMLFPIEGSFPTPSWRSYLMIFHLASPRPYAYCTSSWHPLLRCSDLSPHIHSLKSTHSCQIAVPYQLSWLMRGISGQLQTVAGAIDEESAEKSTEVRLSRSFNGNVPIGRDDEDSAGLFLWKPGLCQRTQQRKQHVEQISGQNIEFHGRRRGIWVA